MVANELRFTLHSSLSLPNVASKLPFTYTGADFYALCSDAMLKAVTRQASHVDAKIAIINTANEEAGKSKISTAYFFDHYAEKEDVAVMVTEEDFMSAERELVPSVSLKELEHYKRVRAQFEKPEEKIVDSRKENERPRLLNGGESEKKGKAKVANRKGKGKATSNDEEEEDEFYTGGGVLNGKGKGKAVDHGFQDGNLEDEEGLY